MKLANLSIYTPSTRHAKPPESAPEINLKYFAFSH